MSKIDSISPLKYHKPDFLVVKFIFYVFIFP